ncbi:MAG: outer membrane beta-barrel protein [Chitinophagaceae bacterium]
MIIFKYLGYVFKYIIMLAGTMLLLITFSIIYNPLKAQTKLIGKIMKGPNDPLEYANVLLLQFKDSSLVKGTISDKNGQYIFQKTSKGKYLLSISFTGFEKAFISPISLTNEDYTSEMGEIVLIKSLEDLKSVNVVAKKQLFEQKIDRMIINVSSSITYAGGSALEVLERSPGVLINQQNSTISMNGKEGVAVMINNKINRMPINVIVEMLSGMSANSIERIELITSPPAGMDAEGSAGYINIILKSTTESGTNGSYAITGGFSHGESAQASMNFNHRKKLLNFFGDFSFSRTRSRQLWDVYNKVIYQGKTKEIYLDVYRPSLQLLYNYKFGADYTLSDKTILGFIISGYSNQQSRTWNNHSELRIDQNIDTILFITNHEINNWSNLSGNFNMQHSFNKNEKIFINANYDYYYSNNPVEYINKYYDANSNFIYDHYMESTKRTPITIWVAAIDYTKNLSAKINMEAGMKGTLSGFVNKTETHNLFQNNWQKDELLSSIFNLRENILAGYVSFSVALNKATTIKAGLRYENTFSNLGSEKQRDIVDRNYGNLFPSFFLSRTFNEYNLANFSYSRRITRPTFNNLAPTTIFVDPYSYFYGNPALLPSINTSFSGSYTFHKKILSISYSQEIRPITNYLPKTDAATNIRSYSAENQKNLLTFTTAVTIPINFFTWWTSQVNLSAVHQVMNVYIKETVNEIKQQYIMATLSQTFALPNDVSVEASGSFNSGGFFGIFIRKPYGAVNAGIQKKFAKHRSSIRLNAVNILNTMATNIYVDLPERNLVSHFILYMPYPAYRLTYTYNFGNDKLKQVRKRVTGAEDVKQRVE